MAKAKAELRLFAQTKVPLCLRPVSFSHNVKNLSALHTLSVSVSFHVRIFSPEELLEQEMIVCATLIQEQHSSAGKKEKKGYAS